MEQNKNWADAGKNEFITSYLKSQIEEALPNSRPQTHIHSSDNSDQITIVCFHKPTEDLSKSYKLANNLNRIFADKGHVTLDENNDIEGKRGNIIELTVTGNISELTDTIKIDIISEYLKGKIEAIDVKPTPTAEITVTKKPDSKHQFHVMIMDNRLQPYSGANKKLRSDAISMMQAIFNGKNVIAEKLIRSGIPPMDDVAITGTVDKIIKEISEKDKEFNSQLHVKGSYRQ